MKYWIAGLLGIVLGIALLSVNFWLGVVVIGASTLTARHFQGRATQQVLARVAQKKVAPAVKSSATPHAPQAPHAPSPDQDPIAAAMQRAIEEQRKTDPLIGPKVGCKEVIQRLINGMKTEKGVHIESMLCALGSLAGYACQANLRAQAVDKGQPETAALTEVKTSDGKTYFFGDPLNKSLAESQYSVWSLAAGGAQQHGCTDMPDLDDIFKHVASSVGSDAFGVPRLPGNHMPGDAPQNYVKVLWPALLPVLRQFCQSPSEWPILYGLAVQEVIGMGKEVIAPDLALRIVMESAIPMSKIDLTSI